MKKLIFALITGAVIMGIFDGGDMTGAFVLGMIFLPAVFEKKEKNVGDRQCQGKTRVRRFARQ